MKMHAREMVQAGVQVDNRHEDSLHGSYSSSGLYFCRSNTFSDELSRFCHLYLPRILLMRSGDVETNPGPDSVSQEQLEKIAWEFPHDHYTSFSNRLGTKYNKAQGILKKHKEDYHKALMEILMAWKTKTGGPYSELAAALRGSEAGGLVAHIEPGSETEPLSPELVKRCAKDFKLKYRETLCKIRADPLDPDSLVQFEDMYTNLFLEKEERKIRQPLKYEDLFNLKVNKEFPRRLLVQGEAGSGKTTFCAKIAWDWINGSSVLSPYVWTIIVPLREAQQYTIGEIAKSYLTKENPTTAHQITEYIRSHQEEVFIAFDGLDEFGGKLVQQGKDGSKSESAQSPSTDQMQPPSSPSAGASVQPSISTSEVCGSLSKRGEIGSILRSDELSACPVLVTSRPWKASEIRWDNSLRKLYTFIHVEGFSKENVKVYIHKYFRDNKAKADQLVQMIDTNDIVSGNMAPYPIYIAILCLMWKNGATREERFKSFLTYSQIFEEIFAFLKRHYAQKGITDRGTTFTNNLTEIERLMQPVQKLAFNGLQENTLVFKEDDFQQYSEAIAAACKVGILSQEKRLLSVHDKSNEYLLSTFFFRHKLFQEHMAGVHFASLYESDRNEFNRLLEEVVLPRKEEFRYLLCFAVSRNKVVAEHVMKRLLQDNAEMEKNMDLLVAVALESQEQDVAALLRSRVISERMLLSMRLTPHTAAGYMYTALYACATNLSCSWKECGPTMSCFAALMMCRSPFMIGVLLSNVSFHNFFFALLAAEAENCQVQMLDLDSVKCLTPSSSKYFAEALCSMPNVTHLTLREMDLTEEFCFFFRANASAFQGSVLMLLNVKCPLPASSRDLAEALCSMPNLNMLTLGVKGLNEKFFSALEAKGSTKGVYFLHLENVKLPTPASSKNLVKAICSMPRLLSLSLCMAQISEEFSSTLKAKASALKVELLHLFHFECSTPASSQHLVEALCSLPNLTNLTLTGMDPGMEPSVEFCSTLKAKASTLKVQTLGISFRCPEPVSSQNLAEAVCSMPNLTNLTLDAMDPSVEFYSTLKAKASTSKVEHIELKDIKCPTTAASRDLAEALCSVPNLTELTLMSEERSFMDRTDLHEEFCITLNAMASSMKVQSVYIAGIQCSTPPAAQNLGEALCSMPNLTRLTLRGEGEMSSVGRLDLHEKFYLAINAKASSMQDCFPHISRGDFTFNGDLQENLDSFLHSLADFQRKYPPKRTWKPSNLYRQQLFGDVQPSDHSQQQPMGDIQPSDHSQQQPRFWRIPYMEEEIDHSREEEKGFAESNASLEGDDVKDDPENEEESNPEQCEEKSADVRDDEESIENIKGDNHVEGLFDHQGGELYLETHGCILHIPPGALEGKSPTKITLEVLKELPDDLELEGDEMVVSPGFKCLPSGLHFKKPVKLIMPHCAVLNDPRKVRTVLHSWSHHNIGKIDRTPLTASSCKVHHSHFELMLEHFSKGWLTMLWDWLAAKGKWMCFMPYLPNTMPASRKPLMELRLENKRKKALKYTAGRLYQPALDEDYQIMIERKNMKVTCDHAQEDHETKILEYSHLFRTDRCKVAFILDLQHEQENTVVTLKLTQTNTHEILFDTGCMDSYFSLFAIPQNAPFDAPHVGVLSQDTRDQVTGECLNTLSVHVPHAKYDMLSHNLGIEYNQAQNILARHGNDSQKAIRECFAIWKDNTVGSLAVLQGILHKSGLFGLRLQYIEQPMGDVQQSEHSQQQPMGDVQPSDHPQQQPMVDVQPSDHSQQQPLGDVQPSDHPQQHPMGDVQPLDNPQQQPMGDVQPSDHSQHQPMGDVQPSDHSQQQAMSYEEPSRPFLCRKCCSIL